MPCHVENVVAFPAFELNDGEKAVLVLMFTLGLFLFSSFTVRLSTT